MRQEFIGVEYHPVRPSEETAAKLDVHCEELGLFPYELRLRATPAPAEETTRVVAMLGGTATLSLTVNNPAKRSATFAIEVSVSRDVRSPPFAPRPKSVRNVSRIIRATRRYLMELRFKRLPRRDRATIDHSRNFVSINIKFSPSSFR